MPAGGALLVRAENLTLAGQVALPLPKGRYVKISIKDHGIGIAPEFLTRIFDPFFTTKLKGSGLGLATAFSIIRRHQGHIQVESALGRGAMFSIYLPALPEAKTGAAPARAALYQGTGRILLMDDEEFLSDVIGEMVKAMGFSVTFARRGEEAIEQYKQAMSNGPVFSAAILDLTIPGGMGGRETLEKLLQLNRGIKAIAASGYSNDPVIANPIGYGFKAALRKPFSIMELSAIFREIFQIA
jgi:CheY-like chemotaxis protein